MVAAMDEARVFGEFPLLSTARLRLRELRPKDAPAANALFSDPQVMRYVGRPVHKSQEDTIRSIEGNRVKFPNKEGVHWALTLHQDDRFIGSCCYWHLMKEHHRAEIGYDLLPLYWGQGLMCEALTAVLRYGFEVMELHSTEAQIDPDNLRSRRVLERLGFRQDGLIRENYFFEGRYTDTAIFTLLRREFLGAAAG